ncbi:MAG: excinuclease ABC subunit UvrC [Treponema sp.]|jgi:excinuclease ABC subunit C|nr:excinuclease ABC subunit UvrC [Treponema sp.]
MNHERFGQINNDLKAAAREAPLEPGVYIMRDEENCIIYVGKAKILRNRLSSYFAGGKDLKTTALLTHTRSIETIIVASEYDALLLENTLIKQHSPKYNINLKDGKSYPVIRVTSDVFPRVFKTRHIINDGSLYFGPFPQVQAVDSILELAGKLFPLRKCKVFRKRTSPCMYYHIDRCLAPCCGKISAEEYRIHIERIRKLLEDSKAEGISDAKKAVIGDLRADMNKAAAALQFERAALIRNTIRAVEDISGGNSVVDFDPEGRDYIAWAAEGILTTFAVISMRGGRMTGSELFRTRSAADETDSLETFFISYYSADRPPPAQIYIQGRMIRARESMVTELMRQGAAAFPVSGSPEKGPGIGETADLPDQANSSSLQSPPVLLKKWFETNFASVPDIRLPAEKRHEAALAMAHQNALEDLRRRLKERGAGPALDELARILGLKTSPLRIEGFDIAQLDGRHPVASLISFKNGMPDKKNYRYFKLRTVVGIVDDFAAMREAVRRRYSRLVREEKELPDLILIDGGIGQVNAAKGVLDSLGIDCGLAGLAKQDEEIYLPYTASPIRLSKRSEALKVLQFIRDETHRFATGLNQKLRSKDLFLPALESVEGIGPKRAAEIMRVYGSLESTASAQAEDIAERCKLTVTLARAVKAAAALALEKRKTARERLVTGKGRRAIPSAGYENASSLAEEALAAEREEKYL